MIYFERCDSGTITGYHGRSDEAHFAVQWYLSYLFWGRQPNLSLAILLLYLVGLTLHFHIVLHHLSELGQFGKSSRYHQRSQQIQLLQTHNWCHLFLSEEKLFYLKLLIR